MACLLCVGCVEDSTNKNIVPNGPTLKYKYTVLSIGTENRTYDKTYLTNDYTYHHYGITFKDEDGKEVFLSGNIRIEEQ